MKDKDNGWTDYYNERLKQVDMKTFSAPPYPHETSWAMPATLMKRLLLAHATLRMSEIKGILPPEGKDAMRQLAELIKEYGGRV